MSDNKTELPPIVKTTGQSPPPPLDNAVRQRLSLPHRTSSPQNASSSSKPALGRRRSSLLSYSSIEDLHYALTEDIINPSMTRERVSRDSEEVTHWHSTPLAFAILPAVGGLFFKNGSAFITDVLIIVLAAIFMNWSIRLPWDWYYSAQSQRRDVELEFGDDTLDEENEDTAVESASSAGNSPRPSARLETVKESEITAPEQLQIRQKAAVELRRQELVALFSTFLFPVLTAYLLHVVRGQLSPSSTGLVSDYNLTIFLLAAEIRPCRQLIRLLTRRTLHLQRTVTGLNDPFGAALEEKATINNLESRILELEAKLTDHTMLPQNASLAQKADVTDLSTEVRKRYEPRLEGLERAVRRYEKRTTTLAMLTEQRLGSLEQRLQDALSLAAVAAQQSQTRGTFAKLLDSVATIILWPLKLAYAISMSPVHALEELYIKIKVILFGSAAGRTEKRSASKARLAARDERFKERNSAKKIAR